MLLGEYTLYLHLLLLPPPTTVLVAVNTVKRILSLPSSIASPSFNYLLLSILLQEYSLYLHLLLLPPSTTCCCQYCYKNTLSTFICCFSLLQLLVAVNTVTRILSLPSSVASPSFNYLLLSILLQEYSLYLHLLLLPPSNTCCWQC
jgi:hypothetical protein